jgi:hypothetical protein
MKGVFLMFNSKWMQAVVVVITMCSVQAYATETAKDPSQIKTQSVETPVSESKILAGAELKAVAAQDSLSEIDDMAPEKPAFEKPMVAKPTFEKPKL